MSRLVDAMLLEQSDVSGPTCALHGAFGSVGQAPAPSRGAGLSPQIVLRFNRQTSTVSR